MIRMLAEKVPQQVGQFFNRGFVVRSADVKNLAVRDVPRVFDDGHEAVDAIFHVGKTALLKTTIHEFDGLPLDEVQDELGHHPGAALLGCVQVIQLGADPVEGAEQGELEAPFLAVGPDDPIQELLAAGIDPALLVNGAQDQRAVVLEELRVGAHAVNFGGGGENDAGAVFDALADDAQVFLEVQFEDRERLFDVGHGSGDGHQGKNHVALFDVVLDPFLVDGDVPFQVVEAGVSQDFGDLVGVEVHAENFPVPGAQDALHQSIADEAIDAEYQYVHLLTLFGFFINSLINPHLFSYSLNLFKLFLPIFPHSLLGSLTFSI